MDEIWRWIENSGLIKILQLFKPSPRFKPWAIYERKKFKMVLTIYFFKLFSKLYSFKNSSYSC